MKIIKIIACITLSAANLSCSVKNNKRLYSPATATFLFATPEYKNYYDEERRKENHSKEAIEKQVAEHRLLTAAQIFAESQPQVSSPTTSSITPDATEEAYLKLADEDREAEHKNLAKEFTDKFPEAGCNQS